MGFSLWSCKDEPNNEPPATMEITFNKTEYYPFDAVLVQLPEAATAQEYTGELSGSPITAHRCADSTLVIALPDLAAADYTLSLKIGNDRAEGKFKVKTLPTVANPEAVIDEIKTSFVEILSAAAENNFPNISQFETLVEVFNEEIGKMTEAQRRQFAAYWQANPELHYSPDENEIESKSLRLDELAKASLNYVRSISRLNRAWTLFWVSSGAALYTGGNPFILAVWAASMVNIVYLKEVADVNGKKAIIAPSFKEVITDATWTVTKSSMSLKNSTKDVTLKNGDRFTAAVMIEYRSITDKDIGGTKEANDISVSSNTHSSIWNKLSGAVDELRKKISKISPLTGQPLTVSEIKTPLVVETEPASEWMLQIISGNVTAQKQSDNSYIFTTTAMEDVEFTFKITAEEMETEVFTGLLEVELETPEITTASLANGFEGTSYNVTLAATGTEPLTWSIASGALPSGLSLDTETGIISGTPTAGGDFTFVVKVENIAGNDTKEFTIKVEAENPLVGRWLHVSTTSSYKATATGEYHYNSDPVDDGNIYEFTSDRRLLSSGGNIGSYCPFQGYGIETCLSIGAIRWYTIESSTSLFITWRGTSYGREDYTINYHCIKISD